ncbi:hypothetical protein F7R91_31580 [Streptomyces luteolifulvus]|uniref:Tetratricopeptide repeat protein n=1 Tax=Streptomyces luteolifulvus TaxID=2615112 RepID=A0A6H9UUL4_9ACTN|nr:hypothetical protein [Streptomyces luteolifulvus]KAB1141749.1 hypothetical protein F7R91_31580 [Streptomyces luteolifulvus]
MVGNRTRQDQDAHVGTAAQPPSSSAAVEVLIRPDGSVLVQDAPFPVPDGEPVHVAVLDAMHRQAQALGEPVEAAILDRQEGYATRVEVDPDGSSRILRHEQHDEMPEAEPRPAAGPPPAGPPPAARPTSAAGPSHAGEPLSVAGAPSATGAERSSPIGPAPAEPPHPDGTRPVAVDTHVPEAVPADLAELVGLVRQSLDAGALERAAALAFRLREHTARAFGPEHPHTLEAHALEAFVAHRSDNHRLATATCLGLARIRHRQGDPRAREELMRAVAAWLLIDDVPSAVDHGRALLAALLAVWPVRAEKGGPTVTDAAVPHLVNRRMHALTAASATHVTGAA